MVTVERYFQHHIRNWIQELGDNISILDVGCGTGHIGLWLAGEYPLITANCQDKDYDSRHKLKNLKITGIDSYKPALKYISRLGIYDKILDIELSYSVKPLQLLNNQKFDIALAYGVMAHLPKGLSLRVVHNMLELADNVIVTAPRSLVQHENIDNSSEIEQLQHKAKFECSDFEKLGLQTRMLSYQEDKGNKMTFLNTFLSPYTFALSAIHARMNYKTHFLNRWGDGMIAWRAKK